jgi:hypothetical protein
MFFFFAFFSPPFLKFLLTQKSTSLKHSRILAALPTLGEADLQATARQSRMDVLRLERELLQIRELLRNMLRSQVRT